MFSITRDEGWDEEIKARISMARDAFQKIKSLVSNSTIYINLQKSFLKTYKWSTLLYRCESWNSGKMSEEMLEAVEMCLLCFYFFFIN